ncbi:hypothetical protein P280DRAFT_410335 [Massarina eburnea CBS 473.64]|uniref:Putative lipoate-protein ligase A n=1 Tax=Massarina eburnea CBS 473.64 TaxID=1395130 RepID=A0A6A6RPQ9_9PLEO|nr:hypothetical protein P280DRAFT_410335 [Massarina eburnea CBS 473.64]
MAPSSGLSRVALYTGSLTRPSTTLASMSSMRRALSSWSEKVGDAANRVQSYISRSTDPYLNLSIEEHILRKSPADSHVLFLYVNRPCVVIGRNQNPWLEVNLGLLDGRTPAAATTPLIGNVDLVRRRSGGGAVFHDGGNLNWSVVCPKDDFTRDKHAEMVVRALRKLGVDRARVNERHDIVLDQADRQSDSDPRDTHRTPYTSDGDGDGAPRPLKVSGSAYKMISQRALHHATTLLSSPNVRSISQYLRSPAKDHIQAKGVASVSSPVSNIGVDMELFKETLQHEFRTAYGGGDTQIVGDELLENDSIRKGYSELRTNDWLWQQTPQFTISLQPAANIELIVRHGVVHEVHHNQGEDGRLSMLQTALVGRKLHEIRDWSAFLKGHIRPWKKEDNVLAQQLQSHLPVLQLFET